MRRSSTKWTEEITTKEVEEVIQSTWSTQRREFTSRRSKECWNCGRTGHLSRECTRERPNDEVEGRRAAFNFAMSVRQAKEVTSSGEYIEWVLDSGPSLHYTKHLWALRDEFHVVQTVTEQVGNIKVRTMEGHQATIMSVNYSPSMPVNLLVVQAWLCVEGERSWKFHCTQRNRHKNVQCIY
jgi:hypothetical protein